MLEPCNYRDSQRVNTVLIPPTDYVQDFKILNKIFNLQTLPIQLWLSLNTNTKHVNSLNANSNVLINSIIARLPTLLLGYII